MAITIATAPDSVSFTGLPIDFTVTSNRDSADANTVTLSDYSGTVAGTTKATTGSAHGYVTGDIVTITNTANDGTYAITVIDADEFYFTATYDSSDNSGNCTRVNANFQIKAEVIIAAVTVATLRKFGTGGNYIFDISGILDAQLTAPPQALGSTQPVADTASFKSYTVKFTEEFDDENGLLKVGADTTTSAYYATKGTRQYADTQSTAAYLVASASMPYLTTAGPTCWMSPGEELQLSFIKATTLGGTAWRIYTTENPIGGSAANTASSSTTIADTPSKVVIPLSDALFTNDIAACTSISVKAELSVAGNWLNYLETVTIYPLPVPPSHGKRIWWLNSLGGWDQYTFRGDYMKERDVQKTTYRKDLGYTYTVGARGEDVIKADVKETHTIYSGAINATDAAWISGVLYSKDVRFQNGTSLIPIVVQDGSQVIEDSAEHVNIRLDYVHSNKVR